MATTPAVSDVKYSMLVVPADGVTRQYEFNFAGGYISRDHIKIQYENDTTGVITQVTDLLWVNDNTIALGTTVTTIPVGNTVTVYRDTPKDQPLVDYTDGAIINEANLDRSFDQAIFASAEMVDRFLAVQDVSETANSNALSALAASAAATATANTANTNANTALTQSGQAVATANTAASNAATALSTANGIDAKATTALANSAAAVSTANGIDAKATTALSNSNTAVSTANAASSTANAAQATANGVDAKATTALSDAAAAVVTANAAQATANGVDAKATTALSNASSALATATALDAVAVKRTATTGSATGPAGTTAQRDASPQVGYTRVNTTTGLHEYYDGTSWVSQQKLLSRVVFDAFAITDQAVAFDTATKVVLGTVASDSHGGWSSANNQYTVPVTGWYQVFVGFRGEGSTGTTGVRSALYKNGSGLARFTETVGASSSFQTMTGARLLYFTAGEVIALYGSVTGTGSAKFNPAGSTTGEVGPRLSLTLLS